MAIKDSHSGHHGYGDLPKVADPGAVGSGYIEADIAKRINTAIRKYAGVPDTTDYKGTNVNQILANTVRNMNRYPGDYHISIHLNAFNGKASGIEVWYWAGDEPSRKKAVELAKVLSDFTGLPNRGAKATVSFYVLRNSVGRTLLLEVGFIDNPNDMKKVVPKIDAIGKKITQVMGAYKEPAKPKPPAKPSTPKPPAKKSISTIAKEVINGDWGNGADRTSRLKKAGYNPTTVQTEVNKQLNAKKPAKKSNHQIAQEVLRGDWGNGADRIKRLKAAGYNPNTIQSIVNRM